MKVVTLSGKISSSQETPKTRTLLVTTLENNNTAPTSLHRPDVGARLDVGMLARRRCHSTIKGRTRVASGACDTWLSAILCTLHIHVF